ncbi:MAG: ribosomal L7Ae/L30e/S12e/Gadd45 family protein [Paenibacillaceae bacterium]|jgi:ribosomal protein L7Ae-like RNA K-turn-binding protein|nr:ribosomal L7Ae/L30e/S12e/Gadd45 family protein [Paenibacillaceae bacterium]
MAKKSGALVAGDEAVMKAIRARIAHLVLVAADASPRARKKYTDKAAYYGVAVRIVVTREALGKSIGSPDHVVAAICDAALARRIAEAFDASV